jgi:hypothetical protein
MEKQETLKLLIQLWINDKTGLRLVNSVPNGFVFDINGFG